MTLFSSTAQRAFSKRAPFFPPVHSTPFSHRQTHRENPFLFIARQGFHDLVRARGAREKVLPLLGRIIAHIRVALRGRSVDVYNAACTALRDLATLVGEAIAPHVSTLVVPIHSRATQQRECTQAAETTLRALAEAGGPQAVTAIRTKIPTFVSI